MVTRRWSHIVAAFAMALVFATAAACGESSDDGPPPAPDGVGGFAGVVTDAGGAPVADMRVAIVSGTASFPEIAAVTNASGAYTIGGVPRGTFEVAVFDLQGRSVGDGSGTVTAGETATLDFTVSP